ncbi:protein patched-like [Centruroides sculpturatus]|uniref:protein patched-like n=1 Tax=Centruroides sculpturatus TaxID=218467 RepID=UPI000C6CDC68|nr:protein patched-like [Centruroides sculpturatus]
MISTGNSNGVTPFYIKKERLHVDLVTRTSWTDAATALAQINKGKATGNRAALWLRAKLQCYLFQLGCFIQRNAGKVVFVGLLVLSTFCVGLKSATLQSNVEKLWVEEGGRLERELAYIRNTVGQGFGSTNQIIIQTPRYQGVNVLNQETLLTHLRTVKEATQVVVDMFDVTWRLKDLCYSPSVPSFDAHYIDSILENLFPCAIITPLDCFWEGAKLLGPEFPVTIPGLGINVQWTNLNPQLLVEAMKNFGKYVSVFPFDTLEDFMIRAGITTAYQEKPCLDPTDEQCPETSPNKHSQQIPDIGGELTGGCYGFATRYMQWPENLIVGGITRNRTGHIIKAEALQTVVQLMAEKEMYEFWQDTYKVHNIDWTPDKAKMVLETWQRKFTEAVLKQATNANNTKNHNINAFSSTSLTDIMQDFSEVSVTRLALGYILMLVYACVSLLQWTDAVKSQSGIGIAGVLLVAITVAAGLGFCAIIGISFNASTTQIVPFLALGLGVDDMFLLAHTYGENANIHISAEEQTGQCLKQTGVSVLLTSFSNMCAFFAAAIIPIPALRAFALQAAILVIFNVAAMLLIFPAIVSLDLRRRRNNKMDIFCCFNGHNQISPIKTSDRKKDLIYNNTQIHQIVTHALPPDLSHAITVLAPPMPKQPITCWTENSVASSIENLSTTNSTSTKELIAVKLKQSLKERVSYLCFHAQQDSWSLAWFATHIYAPFLQKTSTKVLTIVLFLIAVIASIWGMLSVDDGLDLTDIVPRNTNEYKFLSAQSKYFGFFNMFAITQGNFEYPTNQKLLYEYHEAFTRIDKIIKNDDGGLPDFWLAIFRDWLSGLQKVFDRDWKRGCITQEKWYPNASDEGILAYKLLVQTGRVDNPIDKSLVTTVRLVDSEGIINPKAFYNYLTAWVSNDVLAYSASQANFKPEPRQWIHVAQDVDLKIPKSQALVYTQLPFYLTNMKTTSVITSTIQAIRAICTKFEKNGLPNFPTGIPFTYWEQYIGLRFHLTMSLLCVFVAIFLAVSLVLLNPWAAFIMVSSNLKNNNLL